MKERKAMKIQNLTAEKKKEKEKKQILEETAMLARRVKSRILAELGR